MYVQPLSSDDVKFQGCKKNLQWMGVFFCHGFDLGFTKWVVTSVAAVKSPLGPRYHDPCQCQKVKPTKAAMVPPRWFRFMPCWNCWDSYGRCGIFGPFMIFFSKKMAIGCQMSAVGGAVNCWCLPLFGGAVHASSWNGRGMFMNGTLIASKDRNCFSRSALASR